MPPPLGRTAAALGPRAGASRGSRAAIRPDVDHRALLQLRRRRRSSPARAARRARRARGQRAGHRLPGIAQGARSTARCSSSRCAAGASASARRRRPDRDAERGDPAGRDAARARSSSSSGAPTPSGSTPARAGRCRSRGRPAARSRSSPGAFRSWHGAIHLVDAIRQLRARGADDVSARAHRRRPGAAARAQAARRASTASSFTGARAARRDARVPGRRRHRRRAVRRRRARAAVARLLLVAAEDLRVHGRRACPVVAPALPRIPSLVGGRPRRRCSTMPAGPGRARRRARATLTDAGRCAPRLGAAARARAVRDYSWAAHCRDARRARFAGPRSTPRR